MAVYTVLGTTDFEKLAGEYAAGQVVDFKGISDGVENSNYFLTLAPPEGNASEYVLTIAENQSCRDIEFIARLLTLLQSHQLPVPAPIATNTGALVTEIHGKPALLIPKIHGTHPMAPSLSQCQAIGAALGRIHQVVLASDLEHTSHRNLTWMLSTARTVQSRLPPEELKLFEKGIDALGRITQARQQVLPRAVIHGDLFRDNTLFKGDQLNAVIDFFSAGTGYLFFDLAVVINDWCMDTGGQLDSGKSVVLLGAYAEHRIPTRTERALWPDFLRVAALRFWISRLAEQQRVLDTSQGMLVNEKNPDQYRAILEQHSLQHRTWPL